MVRKRVWFAVLVALLIVFVGGYWTFQEPQTGVGPEETPLSDITSTQQEWKISPESVNFDGTVQIEGDAEFQGLNLSGRVQFPEESDPESVELLVRILPLSPKVLDEMENKTSGENIDTVATQYLRSDTISQDPLRKVIVTDPEGAFSISNAPPGLYRAEIQGADWLGSTEGSIVQRPDATSAIEVSARPSARLEGQVVDSSGEPLGDVTVRSLRSDWSVRTDENGEFTFGPISPGEPVNYLQIEQPGLGPESLSLSPFNEGEVREKTFEIIRSRELVVQVRTETGQPVEKGDVLLRRTDDRQLTSGEGELREGMRVRTIDADGTVRFEGLQPGTVEVNLHHPQLMAEWSSVSLEESTQEAQLTGRRGHSFTVEMYDEETEEPVRGLLPRILVFDQQGNLLRPGLRGHERTEGTFRSVLHPDFSEGILRVDGERRGYEQKTIQFDRGDLDRLEVSLNSKGQNTDNETPTFQKFQVPDSLSVEDLDRLELFFVDKDDGGIVQTRSGGASILEEAIPLPRGEFYVYGTAELNRDQKRVIGQNLTVQSDHPDSKPLSFHEPARISGRIQGPDENRQGLEVAVDLLGNTGGEVYFAPDYPKPLRTTPDEDGRFSFDSVPPGRVLQVHVVTTRENNLELPPGTVVVRGKVEPISPNGRFSLPDLRVPATP